MACDSSHLSYRAVDGAMIISPSATLQINYSTPSWEIFPSFTNLNFCEVNIHLTHADADGEVLVRFWLPSTRDDWNKRFQASGGGGFAMSLGFLGLAPAVKDICFAQRFPNLLDDIMAAAPALNLVSITMGGFWPQLITKEANTYMSQCEFTYFTKKAMILRTTSAITVVTVIVLVLHSKLWPMRLPGSKLQSLGSMTTPSS